MFVTNLFSAVGLFYCILLGIGAIFLFCLYYNQGVIFCLYCRPRRKRRFHHSRFKEIKITLKNTKKEIYNYYCDNDSEYTLVYLHGNATDIISELGFIQEMVEKLNCNIYVVEYPGYCCNPGAMVYENFIYTGEAMLNELRSNVIFNTKKVFIFGTSLGGVILLHSLSTTIDDAHIKGIIVQNSFTRFPYVVASLLFIPYLGELFWLFCKERWSSLDAIDDFINRGKKKDFKIALLSSEKDKLVPPSMMREINKKFKEVYKETEMHKFKNAGHNTIFRNRHYLSCIKKFISGGVDV